MEKRPGENVDLVVVVDSLNVSSGQLMPLIDRILASTKRSGLKTHINVVMHSSLDPENTYQIKHDLADKYPQITSTSIVDCYTFAFAYLKGLESASQLADLVIELDSGGGHKPEELPKFIEGLKSNDVVFSSRFIKGGINTYPWQRQLFSRGVTLLSNILLGTNLTDAASGFQGFRSNVLKRLFQAYPPETWPSATLGPFHMYQTDIRSKISWMDDLKITEVPITYGAEKIGGQLNLREYIPQTIKCFWEIYKQKADTKKFSRG